MIQYRDLDTKGHVQYWVFLVACTIKIFLWSYVKIVSDASTINVLLTLLSLLVLLVCYDSR
jgi:hypothetical protein